MGDPEPSFGFSRYLEVMLRERYPDMKFEVVNTGSVAINSHVVLPIARGSRQVQPRPFYYLFGQQRSRRALWSRYGAHRRRDEPSCHPRQHSSITLLASDNCLPRWGRRRGSGAGWRCFMDKQVRASSPLMKYAYANYEQNLRDTIAVARDVRRRGNRFDGGHESDGLRSVRVIAPGKSDSG